jgi:hypothetical protein
LPKDIIEDQLGRGIVEGRDARHELVEADTHRPPVHPRIMRCTKHYIYFFKIAIYLSLGFNIGRLSYRRSLQLSKEIIQYF